MKTTNWLDVFIFQLEWIMADARVLRVDRMNIRFALERIFTA